MTATRILIVENEAIIAMDLRHHLESFGYSVVPTAVSGEQALARIAETKPDLILMDILIKGPIDGIATAEMVNDDHRVPVIFLSANSDEATVHRARAAGAYGYLVKPFRPEEVRASIEVALFKAKMETQLRQSEQWFAKTLHCISDAVVATNSEGIVRFINPVAERLTGWTQVEACGQPVEHIVQSLDEISSKPAGNPILDALHGRSVTQSMRTALVLARDGGAVPVDEGAAPIVDDDGNLMGAVLVFRDITQRRDVERALRESEKRFHSAFDHAAIGMALVAMDGCILQNNRSIAAMLGYGERELQGMNLLALSHPDDLDVELDSLRALAAHRLAAFQIEKRFLHRDGRAIWTLLSVSMVHAEDDSPLYRIVQTQDLSTRKHAEEQLIKLAHHDQLTGLANRTHFIALADQVIAAARRNDESCGLLFVDLDGFKAINDTLGHHAGDQLLQITAKRTGSCLRDSDVLGRWGGDEIVLMAQSAGSEAQLEQVAARILLEIGKPSEIDGEAVRVSASIGIALYPRDGRDLTALIVSADDAMYQAKELGKNQYCFSTQGTAPAILRLSRLEAELRNAVEEDELRLHYQPILYRGQIESVEALVRWQHPRQGLMPPNDFIPLAEKTGLILPIGKWVLATACMQARQWHDHGLARLKVAVNLSARQLRAPDFTRTVAAALAAARLEADALELELTESWVMGNVQLSTQILNQLREIGVLAAVDDFGTGYSSLAYLKRLPLRRLKIDRVFLNGVPGDAQGESIVRAIVSLARELRLDVVVEGVETEIQRQYLLALGDLYLQGYGLYRPMEPERLTAVVLST